MDSATAGMIMWVVIFAAAYMIRRVSRNKQQRVLAPSTGTGPKWEQDIPYALDVEDDEEDW